MSENPTTGRPAPNGRPPASGVSFRVSLLRNLILLILALSVAILSVSIFGTRRAVRTLCEDLVVSGTDRLETELRRFFEPVPPILHVAESWARQGLLESDNPDDLNTLLAPVLTNIPQVAGLSTGDTRGNGFMVARAPEENEWINQIVTPETVGRRSSWRQWKTFGDPLREWEEEKAYDPRTRPWFQLVAAPDAVDGVVRWTEPYPFFSTGEPGITASIPVKRDDGTLRVISVDLLLRDISRLTTSLTLSPNSFMLVTTSDVRVIGLPRHEKFTTDEDLKGGFLKNPSELGIPLIAQASLKVRETFGLADGEVLSVERGLSEENQPFRWTHEGEAWWFYVRPCELREGPQLWIGVAVPENDFLGELKEGRKYYYLFLALALLVAALISVRLARRYSRPIQALIQQSNRLRSLNTDRTEHHPDDTQILEIAQLQDAQESMRVALDSFARYVPSGVVRQLLEKGEAAVIGGQSTSMSILFTDIEGFTTISELMTPTDLTNHMSSYFQAMIEAIESHRGVVDKLIGDAIVAFWNAPSPNECHARDAVAGALACREKLEELNRQWEAQSLPRLPTRFGIATGDVVVGNVGSPMRLNYTALGDTVNLASRLEGANAFYGTRILVSETTRTQAGDHFLWRRLDRISVKGRTEPELVFELLGEEGSVPSNVRDHARKYEDALDLYLARDFNGALAALEPLIVDDEIAPSIDRAATRLAELCRKYLEHPPEEKWDGVSRFTSKQ